MTKPQSCIWGCQEALPEQTKAQSQDEPIKQEWLERGPGQNTGCAVHCHEGTVEQEKDDYDSL